MTTATFPLIGDEEEDPGAGSTGTATLSELSARVGTGVGPLSPFRRDQRNDFVSGSGAALLSSEIAQVLGTRADDGRMSGELPWRTDFGSLLHTIQFDNIDETMAALIRSRVAGALAHWLPQVKVKRVSLARVKNAYGDIVAKCGITYDVVSVPGSNNLLAANQEVDIPLS